jgi:hypothetical protein
MTTHRPANLTFDHATGSLEFSTFRAVWGRFREMGHAGGTKIGACRTDALFGYPLCRGSSTTSNFSSGYTAPLHESPPAQHPPCPWRERPGAT